MALPLDWVLVPGVPVQHYRRTETLSKACRYRTAADGDLVPGVPVQPVIGSPPTCLYLYITIQFEVEMEFLTV